MEEPPFVGVGTYKPFKNEDPSGFYIFYAILLYGFHVPFSVGCIASLVHSYGKNHPPG